MSNTRKIIHIDMDAFFAAVEQRDQPRLRNKPVIIAGPAEKRGVVSTCSYEARAFGIHSAMSAFRAKKLCPEGIFIAGNMEKYRAVSHQIREIFAGYTDLVEPLSIDEAFLDVTAVLGRRGSATKLAAAIQREVFCRTSLTCSAGVSYNKFLAKVASGMNKPCGLAVIPPEHAVEFLENLPVEKFYGIGHVTASRLRNMNIRYGRDLKALSLDTLKSNFGKMGELYYGIVRGNDPRPVEVPGERKSIGRETTLPADTCDLKKLRIICRKLALQVAASLQRKNLQCRSVTLKIKYGDFTSCTRTASFHQPSCDGGVIGTLAASLLERTEAGSRPVRLVGVTAGNFRQEQKEEKALQLEFDFRY